MGYFYIFISFINLKYGLGDKLKVSKFVNKEHNKRKKETFRKRKIISVMKTKRSKRKSGRMK